MGISSVNMILLTISTFLTLSQAQQPDWCLDAETGTMMCLSGSTLHQKAMDAYVQCSNLGDYGSDMPAGRSIFAAAQQKRNVEERQAGQCPPVNEMGITVNDPNPNYFMDPVVDCVLAAMDFLAPEGFPRNKKISQALGSIVFPNVLESFFWGNNTRQRWDNCRSAVGISSFYMSLASECADSYTEDEVKALKFYGARNDAYTCLSYNLPAACKTAFYTTAYTSAWTTPDQGNGSDSGIISVLLTEFQF